MKQPLEMSEIREQIRKLMSETMKLHADRVKTQRDALLDFVLASIGFVGAISVVIKILFGWR